MPNETVTPGEVAGLVERLNETHTCDGCDEYAGSYIHDLMNEAATALEALSAEVSRCHARLVIDRAFINGERVEVPFEDRATFPDGIMCRDETIRLQDARIEALSAELAAERAAHAETKRALDEARKALESFANVAELIEVDTEGFSETDIFDLTFNDYRFERFTLSQFQAARRALEGGE